MLTRLFTILLVLAFLVGCGGVKGVNANIPKETPTIQTDKPTLLLKPRLKVTHESSFNPVAFLTWKQSPEPMFTERLGNTYVYFNPKRYAAIPFAFVYMAEGGEKTHGIEDGTLLSYCYIEDGEFKHYGGVTKREEPYKVHFKRVHLVPKTAAMLKGILEEFAKMLHKHLTK